MLHIGKTIVAVRPISRGRQMYVLVASTKVRPSNASCSGVLHLGGRRQDRTEVCNLQGVVGV